MHKAHSHFEPDYELSEFPVKLRQYLGLHRTKERGKKRQQVMRLVASSFKKVRTTK